MDKQNHNETRLVITMMIAILVCDIVFYFLFFILNKRQYCPFHITETLSLQPSMLQT
jgi:hypothetical protein